MPSLGHVIREIQRDAAALPTRELRDEIGLCLQMQDEAIRQYCTIPPGGRTPEDLVLVSDTVMFALVTTALYVRELTTRPVDRAVLICPN
jgi:hypothetical protein